MSERAPTGGPGMLPYYLGGFLGPFGTGVIVPMLPELRDHFGVGSAAISWGFSAYLFPMAALMLVSGTIGERYGRRLVLRVSLTAFIAASIVASLAPSLWWFLVGRAVQGAGNAFFTPLLIAGLADVTDRSRLGRRVGVYTSFQAAGGGLAPFAGGLAADVDWRLAFWAAAAAALVILVFAPPGELPAGTGRPSLRPLLAPRVLVFGLGLFAAAAGPLGVAVLVGLKTRDLLDMEPALAGLLLASGNLGAMLFGPIFGRLVDRHGARRCGVVGAIAASGLVATLATTPGVATTAAAFAAAGTLFGLVVVVFQKVGALLVPENRGGALSAIMSFRFAGHAAGPLLWVPVFARSPTVAFLGSASLGVVTLVAILVAVGDDRDAEDGDSGADRGMAGSGSGGGSHPGHRTPAPAVAPLNPTGRNQAH